VSFTGRVSDGELRSLLANSRAFLQPGEEDFGIAAVEAQAAGKPVIALGKGGVLETVPPFGGVFYQAPTDEALEIAVERFEEREAEFIPSDLQSAASRFAKSEFLHAFGHLLREMGSVPNQPALYR
jgi:glycosyltransferase involved in cell wall biosynthesis